MISKLIVINIKLTLNHINLVQWKEVKFHKFRSTLNCYVVLPLTN